MIKYCFSKIEFESFSLILTLNFFFLFNRLLIKYFNLFGIWKGFIWFKLIYDLIIFIVILIILT